jgi:2'-hydroxyisoflavone reductase
MKLLVIGGGQFVGWHFVDAARARGHELTLFNRGNSVPPPGVGHIQGDRKGDLAALAGRHFDAVVDVCGYLPRDVERMAQQLSAQVGRYLFVSSVSVYADFTRANDESSALATIDDPDTEIVDGRSYGALKALCEATLRRRIGDARTLVVRPGLVVGPREPTRRFAYWPARLERAADDEPLLVPGTPDDAVQFIDARDLAHFMVDALEAGRAGTFNVVVPPGRTTIGDLVRTCAEAAGRRPRWVWVDAHELERLGLRDWIDLPVWMSPLGDHSAIAQVSDAAAVRAGLRTRPLAQTVADTLAWLRSLPPAERALVKAGLTPEAEADALARWAGRPTP